MTSITFNNGVNTAFKEMKKIVAELTDRIESGSFSLRLSVSCRSESIDMAVVWKRLTTSVICQVAYGFDDKEKEAKLGREYALDDCG